MKTNKTLCSLIAATGIFLNSCSPGIKEGEVYQKYIEPERTYVQMLMIPQIHSTGKSTYTTFIIIPMFIHDDEDYVIKIKKFNQEKGKFDSKTLYLERPIFDSLEIGDYFGGEDIKNAKTDDDIFQRRATEEEKSRYRVKPSEEHTG